jgi:hypothetical protein
MFPKRRAYRVSGSAKLFPQHCQVPNLSRDEHLKALTEELQTKTTVAAGTTKGKALLKLLHIHLDALVSPTPATTEQRVTNIQSPAHNPELRKLQRVTNSPAIMHTRDPTAKRNLIKMTRTHWRHTQWNTPGDVPTIQRSPNNIPANNVLPTQPGRLLQITQENQIMPPVTFTPIPNRGHPKQAQLISQIAMAAALAATASASMIIIPPYPMPGGIRANAKLISQHALNALTMKEALYSPKKKCATEVCTP